MPSVTCLSSKLKLELLNILLESRHGVKARMQIERGKATA